MKRNTINKWLVASIFLIAFISFTSANLVLTNSPQSVYNLGDNLNFGFNSNAQSPSEGALSIYLNCPNGNLEIFKEFVFTNSYFSKNLTIPLLRSFIGNLSGNCKITYSIAGQNKTLSNSFRISKSLKINLSTKSVYSPGSLIKINGTAIKDDSHFVNGKVVAKFDSNKNKMVMSTVTKGKFNLEFMAPADYKSGLHNVSIYVYEQDSSGVVTNYGNLLGFFKIGQVPTNLDIILDNKSVMPGTTLSGKIVLRDQGGDPMKSTAYVAIKNAAGKIVDKINLKTGESFNYPVSYTEAPSDWEVASFADGLINRRPFTILTHEKISLILINRTLTITNVGNVLYSKKLNIFIDNKTVDLNLSLPVGASEKYLITAPKGEYTVKVGSLKKTVSLTGNVVSVNKVNNSSTVDIIKFIVWLFALIVVIFASYIFFKKSRKKKFFGKRSSRKAKKPLKLKKIPKGDNLTNPKLVSELSLSISGTKQNSPVGCIFVKNYEAIKNLEGEVKEVFGKITTLIESRKGIIYENRGNIFYLLPPIMTRTFKNEVPIYELSKEIKEVLDEHNKKFRVKINYGIALSFGVIVSQSSEGKFKFMSLESLMSSTKKLSNNSSGEILLTSKFKERLPKEFKLEKFEVSGRDFYKVKSFEKNKDNSTFIKGFLERQKRNSSKEGK